MAEPVTAVEAWRARRRWRGYLALALVAAVFLAGIVAIVGGVALLLRATEEETASFADIREHFMYGSIGSEPESGMPYWIWKVLPSLYPEAFEGRDDYAAFGFLYEEDADGERRDLPIGVSRREVAGVDVVWLNCAVCHVGTWRASEDAAPEVAPGMPSNNLDFERFVAVLLALAADERLAPDAMLERIEAAGAELGPVDKLIWRMVVLPRFREGLIEARAGLGPLLAAQPDWGPGRVDTFNPYKVIQFDMDPAAFSEAERIGVADLPAIFNQGPREGMNLHWDGNNPSLAERNLSAAIGAGVTPQTVDHAAIERIADWLRDLPPPPSPHRPDPAAAERGRAIYMEACAACHGWMAPDGYVFEGERLGQVEPIAALGTDPARLDSYTEELRELQLGRLFAGTPYQFRHFAKTDGYANLPLDGLWLRGPYLHNGSVPTLADLLAPPEARPVAWIRGLDVIDGARGGFAAPACDPVAPPEAGFCFDTKAPGNGAGGHAYGTELDPAAKADLLAYLLTF